MIYLINTTKANFLVLFLLVGFTCFSQTITTGAISPTSYCEGDAVSVPYTITGTFNAGNVFTAQLSDVSGAFTSPTNIGVLTSTVAGTITTTLPLGGVAGTAYRIRVVSDNPVIIGSDNGVDLTIKTISTAPVVGAITQPSCPLATGSVDLSGLPSVPWVLTQSPGGEITTGTGVSATVSGISPGTYTYTVHEGEQGLEGEYFNNTTLSGTAALTRTDATVNFNWGSGGPGSPIGNDNFSVRWTGLVVPLVDDDYIFRTNSDDGIRLWVNGEQVIDNWTNHGATYDYSPSISLLAGQPYDIVLEFYERGGLAVAQLDWNRTGAATYVNIPASQLFYNGTNNCSSPASGNVIITAYSDTPIAPIATNGILSCIGGGASSVTLSASAPGAAPGSSYVWYDEEIGGIILQESTSNTYNTPVINTPTNYWVAVKDAFTGCVSELTMVSVLSATNSPDSQTTAGIDSWIGHVYDGNNYSLTYNDSFIDYYGTATEAEQFDQGFGGNYACYTINSATDGDRSIYTEYFSVRYRMNSTREGLYVVNMGSDDGIRLQVDGELVYNYWTPRGYSIDANVLISLNGSSALIFDFFENSGGNRVSFNGLTLVLENNLDENTAQTLCETGVGVPISGDEYGVLPSGVTISGTGYQWAYGMAIGGPWTDIAGATGAEYTPTALDFGGVTHGDTVYLIRKAVLSSANNVGFASPFLVENNSNAATINIDADSNIWIGAVSTDWNNIGNWGCGAIPDLSSNISVPASPTNQPVISSGDSGGLANDIEFETGATLTVDNNFMQTDGVLLLNGFIDLVGEGQLLQTANSTIDAAGVGSLERDQQGKANSFNYNYWSSPVNSNLVASTYNLDTVLKDGRSAYYGGDILYSASAYGADTAPATQLIKSSRWLYTFKGPTDSYAAWDKIDENTNISVGRGFTMKGSLGPVSLTDTENYVFIGMPNNGDIDMNIGLGEDMLIGNPYPSALDADQFIKDQIAATDGGAVGNRGINVINGALYFWDHFGEENSHYLAEYVGGYATRNLIGGTVAISNDPLINDNDASGVTEPGQYIPVGQGFFVSATLDPINNSDNTTDVVGGDIYFRNSQRVFEIEDGVNSIFMKSSGKQSGAKTAEDTRSKIRLMFSSNGYYRQLLVGTDENATSNFDMGYDAPMADVASDDMFWKINNAKFVIQGVSDFNEDAQCPLGLVVSTNELVEIQITELKNVPEETDIYIKDNLTQETHQINESSFKINLDTGEYLNRFSLVFKADQTLSVAEGLLENGLSVYMRNASEELQIRNTTNSKLLVVKLYNTLGSQLNVWTENLDNSVTSLPVSNVAAGMYIVQLETTTGTIAKKVIIE